MLNIVIDPLAIRIFQASTGRLLHGWIMVDLLRRSGVHSWYPRVSSHRTDYLDSDVRYMYIYIYATPQKNLLFGQFHWYLQCFGGISDNICDIRNLTGWWYLYIFVMTCGNNICNVDPLHYIGHVSWCRMKGWHCNAECFSSVTVKFGWENIADKMEVPRKAADFNGNFFPPVLKQIYQAERTNFSSSHWKSEPVNCQRSWPICQYSYWADLIWALRVAEPTFELDCTWTRSLRNRHARSMTCVPAFTRIFFPVFGHLWDAMRT